MTIIIIKNSLHIVIDFKVKSFKDVLHIGNQRKPIQMKHIDVVATKKQKNG
jgi:hypothetical protein